MLKDFQAGKLAVLIGTDVASRGLHVPGVSHVFNYDLPQDPEDYVHRIGRTARAGASGKAFSLACEHHVYSLEAIEEFIAMTVPHAMPEAELVKMPRPQPRAPRPEPPPEEPSEAAADGDAPAKTRGRRSRSKRSGSIERSEGAHSAAAAAGSVEETVDDAEQPAEAAGEGAPKKKRRRRR